MRAITEKDSSQLPTDPLSKRKNKAVSQVFNKLYFYTKMSNMIHFITINEAVTADLQCFMRLFLLTECPHQLRTLIEAECTAKYISYFQ